jgi:L-histidine Nalpha-methyltransferase
MEGTMSATIFISHISDESELADVLKDAISKDFLGIARVFVSSDLESIQAGQLWLNEIEQRLEGAAAVVVFCSPKSISRPWINFEAGAAWLHKKPIVPVCYNGLTLGQLPMPMSLLQGIVATDPVGLRRLYMRIAEKVDASILPNRDFAELAARLRALERPPPPGRTDADSAHDPKSWLDDTALSRAIEHAHLGWTLCFIGEDQTDRVAQLTQDLEEGQSSGGNGKRFASGFSYWGIGPTLAWTRACTDPMYLVAKKGIEHFSGHWQHCAPKLTDCAHYVSLGVGTGQKDRVILRTLLDHHPHAYFFPVDMSGEMLRVGIGECRKNQDLLRSQILPIQIDFSTAENAASICRVVTSVAGDSPVLYSLLGNTLANFDDDLGLLQVIVAGLRAGDRLLLEVATTLEVTPHAAERAAAEYRRSESFFAFATSALDYYTSIQVDGSCVEFLPSYHPQGALEIRVVYRNKSGDALAMKITTGRKVGLQPDETIRLYLSRKYTLARVDEMLARAGCAVEWKSASAVNSDGFASVVVLASRVEGQAQQFVESRADARHGQGIAGPKPSTDRARARRTRRA